MTAGETALYFKSHFKFESSNQMNLPQTMEGIASGEAKSLGALKVVLPVKPQLLGEILLVARRGANKLSAKVWQPRTLIAFCNTLEAAREQPDLKDEDTIGVITNAWLAFALMAAVLIETYDRKQLAWVSRSCSMMATTINKDAPITAETLSRVADEIRTSLGVKDCACDTCVAVARVHAADAAIEADPVPSACATLVDELRNATNELIESIKTRQANAEARAVATVNQAKSACRPCELN